MNLKQKLTCICFLYGVYVSGTASNISPVESLKGSMVVGHVVNRWKAMKKSYVVALA